jgi:hypothetical protein
MAPMSMGNIMVLVSSTYDRVLSLSLYPTGALDAHIDRLYLVFHPSLLLSQNFVVFILRSLS